MLKKESEVQKFKLAIQTKIKCTTEIHTRWFYLFKVYDL